VSLGNDQVSGTRKRGRSLSYVTRIHYRCAEAFGYNGNLLVGKAYTAQLELRPGDEFEIKLGRKQIRLVPVGGADEEE
jgi:hypothetical protein